VSAVAGVPDIQAMVVQMGERCGAALTEAVRALRERLPETAQAVVDGDHEVNTMEQEIEARCLRLLGERRLTPPELREINAALKMATDLERVGDHAVDIAKASLRIGVEPLIKPLIDIPRMAHLAATMLERCFAAYGSHDAAAAEAAARLDDDLDGLYGQVFRELLTYMIEDPGTIRQGTHLLFVASHLERIADHATNLAESVVYLVTGRRPELND
jgi:phosphate transport system protein